MKSKIVFNLFLFISPFLFYTTVNAQDSDEEVSELMSNILILSSALHGENYTIVHIEVDKLKEGQSYSARRKLFSGNKYKIIGIGGQGIADLDMKLYDVGGTKIDEDVTESRITEVNVSPRISGTYRFTTTNYEVGSHYSTESEYFFCYVVAYKRE